MAVCRECYKDYGKTTISGICAACQLKIVNAKIKISNFDIQKEKKQKHKEIKRMAWELSKIALFRDITVGEKKLMSPDEIMRWCWSCADRFYNIANAVEKKEKKNDV